MIWVLFAIAAWLFGLSVNIWLARQKPSGWASLASPLRDGGAQRAEEARAPRSGHFRSSPPSELHPLPGAMPGGRLPE